MGKIKLTIDGKLVEVAPGQTVLEAAQENGIHIPTMCAHEALPPYGSCRLCIVEIEGVRGYPTSCTTPVTEGMVVRTQSPELTTLRNRILELMLSGHPSACLVCDHRELCEQYRPTATKAGATTRCAFCSNREECEVRNLALSARPNELTLPTLYSQHLVERDDPFMDRDYNLCILCGRCFRICEKIHGQPAISIINRGKWARIGTSFHKSHLLSGCTFCGSCVDICPTGALTDRYARWYGEPDQEVLSTCSLCAEACSFKLLVKNQRLIASTMMNFNRESRLCALGRFAYAQLVNAPERLRRVMLKKNGEQTPVSAEEAISAVAERLKAYRGAGFAVIASESSTREARHLLHRFAKEVMEGEVGMVPAAGHFADLKPASLREDLNSGKIKAALVTGDFLDRETADKLEYLVVLDFLPSAIAEKADAVFPLAILSEEEGTFRGSSGEVKSVVRATLPRGLARPEWELIRDLAQAMGAQGFSYQSASEITPEVADDPPPAKVPGSPRDKISDLPARYRGHYLADTVSALSAMGLPVSPTPAVEEPTGPGFPVLEKKEVVPNFHLLKIKAPAVARFAKPGQFAIVMVKETSERVPFTLIDWDEKEETITLVVEEVGRSSREVALLRAGDQIAHVSGPLGLPVNIEKYGTVALGGGCYGIGAIYPIARAMKAAGNRVIGVIEAASHYLLYYEDKLREVCDELIIATKDGSRGMKGGVQEAFVNLIEKGTRVDRFIAIGCTFMMRMVAEATRPYGVPTWVALNPIMVDGTGMCGACRLSVAGQTKFACVDGPMFDGHQVDWDELFARRAAYQLEEIEALPQHTGRQGLGPIGHPCQCR